MIARSVSPASAWTGFGGTILFAALVPGMGTLLGSSSSQLASSLLISLSEAALTLVITARSVEPSPLKSPATNAGALVVSGSAAFANTLAIAERTSSNRGGGAGSGVALGVAMGCMNCGVCGVGVAFDSTRGASSEGFS